MKLITLYCALTELQKLPYLGTKLEEKHPIDCKLTSCKVS